ncbi:MAG: spondin domain-containing protein [Fimbriiglobus sp.]|jgi:hypothetical protein|nr:spondin domain-containing protein [Fimbriiglobus sp.]
MALPVRTGLALTVGLLLTSVASAGPLNVTVTVRNVAPANSVAFAALRLGFHNGTFDAFDEGRSATDPIISVAERGNGAAWFQAFQSADPNAVVGSVGGGPLMPGQSATQSFTVDPIANPFFTFATMVVPSNDLFLGNDSPTRFRLFDESGRLVIDRIDQSAADIWDAGSEAADAANAAFLVGGVNDLRTPQNGVVLFDRSELSTYRGLTTRGGYTFDDRLLADGTGVYEIQITATPEPGTIALVILAAAGAVGGSRLRRRAATTGG